MARSNSLRAITTRYKGYSFRSRLEARWAVFFDHLKIRWEYEAEGFELGNGLRYLPDFWLPDWGLWVEVKPDAPDEVTAEKARRLAQQSGALVLVVHGMPGSPSTLFLKRNEESEDDTCSFPCWIPWNEDRVGYVQSPAPNIIDRHLDIYVIDRLDTALYSVAEDALAAARSSRFEFGEKGAA